jgi:hypothetical protein
MLKEELWKRGDRELCYVYEDEYKQIQYLFFKVLGNKRLRVGSFSVVPHRMKFLVTLKEYDLSGWKKLGDNDYILGR